MNASVAQYVGFLLVLITPLSLYSESGEVVPCQSGCNIVHLGGDRQEAGGECHATMHVPCVTQIAASVNAYSTNTWVNGQYCEEFFGPVSWSLEGINGNSSGSSGLSIIGASKEFLGVYYATIQVNDVNSVQEGSYVVVATGLHGKRKTGSVTVKVDCGDTCSKSDDESGQGTTSTAVGSVAVKVKLGRYGFGKSIGALSLHEKYPTNLLFTPQSLRFRYPQGTNNPDCEVVRVGAEIRQIRAPEGYANIVSNTPYSYSIEIYSSTVCSTNKNANGLYTFSGSPLATISVGNPDTTCATSNKLCITDGDGVISNYEWRTNGWELVQGGGLRSQQKSTMFTNGLRIVSIDTRGTNGMVTCDTRTYQSNSFGETLIRDVKGVGAERRTNNFVYYTNTAYRTKGHLMQAEYADGSWLFHEYHTNGLRTNTYSAFLNGAASTNAAVTRTTELRYGSNAVPGAMDRGRQRSFEPRCVVEYVQGHEVSRSYKVYLPMERREIYCTLPGVEWNNSSNLVRTFKYYSNGVNINRLLSVEHSDGVMEIYQYHYHTNVGGEAFVTNVVMKGQPDSNKTNIVDGSRLATVLGKFGQLVTVTETDVLSGLTNFVETYSDYDAYNRPKKITYMDGTFSWTDFGCCGAVTVTNREGTVITYLRDSLKRRTGTIKNGITVTNILDASGRTLKSVRIGTNGSQIVQGTFGYDAVGNQIESTNALGQKTTYSEIITNYQRIKITTYPDSSNRVEEYYRDGQLAKITGTAVHPMRYEYGTEQDGGVWRLYTKEIKLNASGADTSEWTKTYKDMVGRDYKTVYSDGSTRQSFYNIKGQLVKTVDPDGVTTLYAYNGKGEQSIVATDVNQDGIINTNGTDRIQQTVRSVVNNGSVNVQRVATYVWSTNNIATSNLLGMADTSVDGLISWNSRYGLTNQSRTKYAGGGTRYSTNTASDGSQSISHYANGLLQNVTRKNSAGTQLSRVDYFYDEHGRQYAATDARNGTTFYTYNDADRVVATTTPPPGNGASAQTTTYEHDWAGRVSRTVLPDGTSVTNEYHPTGELKKTYGSRNYPVQYAYDPQGRRTNMITWKTFATDSGKATTAWRYDGYRGFLTNKVYDDGKGPFYSYTPGGRLRTRTWARGTVTTYHTNSVGEIFATTYSDTTPAVTNNFDRLGRSTNIVDGSGSRFLAYNATGQLLGETNSSGEMIGQNLRFSYDQYQRRTNHAWYATNTSLLSHSFMFDGASRITNVSDGTYQGGYSHLANSPLISQVTYRSNTTTRMTTAKTYDYLNRLQNITSTPGASGELAVSFDYAYNDANQRTRVNLDDGSFWIYEYDKLGQVVSGKRYWSDWTPVAGQQYEYAFDDIGNRTSTKAGGDDAGGALRSASYTANSLNQYSSRDVPAYLNVLGIANANASVTVNSQSAYRKGEYFWKELSVSNASAAWQAVTNIASLTGTNQTNTGNLFLPKTAEAYTYDLDGNLTSDGRWTNKWDAENRLVDMTSHSSGPSGSRKSLQFAYDSQGRRYSKVVSNWTGSAWTRVLHEKFLYDGWNLLGAFNGTNAAIIRSFLWGLDLSGSMQGAGGVGGLIAFRQHSGSLAGSHFAAYDGNGNVMALVDGKTGSTTARYEYDPFGQTIRASGTMAVVNPVRFSSKVVDDETDYAYYGYRYLNPNSGRWISRDPIEERFDLTLYSYVRNVPLAFIDAHGRFTIMAHPAPGYGNGPIVGECGNFIYEIVWQIDPFSDLDKGGTLVQYVDVKFDIVSCDGGRFVPTDPDPSWWPFYESWQIRKDNDLTGNSRDDRFAMPAINSCSKGSVTITAAATYYDAQPNPPPGFAATGKPPGGILPVSRNPPPPDWGEGEGWLTRRVIASWDCCTGSGRTSVTVE